jgi:hypothetical protein
MTYTAEDVRAMDVTEIVKLIERKTGTPPTSGAQLNLALSHGAARGGGSVMTINLDTGESGTKTPNYEGLAELFNGPDVPVKPRPEFTLRISDPDHFLKTWRKAQDAGPETFRKFTDDVLSLITWAMRDYRDGLNIHPDSCPDSFYWTMVKDGQVAYNGGLIKHGEESPSWSVHT